MALRTLIVALLVTLIGGSVEARHLSGGGSTGPVCPVGSPPPSGSTIFPNTGCSLTDAAARKWTFEATPYQYMNPVGCCYALDVNGQFSGVTAALSLCYHSVSSSGMAGVDRKSVV